MWDDSSVRLVWAVLDAVLWAFVWLAGLLFFLLVIRELVLTFVRPAVVCSWCKTVIKAGRTPVSHGICDDCSTKTMQRWGI